MLRDASDRADSSGGASFYSPSSRRLSRQPGFSVNQDLKMVNGVVDAATSQQRASTPNCFVIHYNAPWRIAWDVWLGLLLIYVMLSVPYREGFDVAACGNWAIFERTIDAFFLVDVFINFFTSYVANANENDHSEQEITALREIARRYLASWCVRQPAVTCCTPRTPLIMTSRSARP